MFLVFLLLLINGSIRGAPIPPNNTMIEAKTIVPQCPQMFTYEEILEILEHNSCEASGNSLNEDLVLHRKRRADSASDDQTVASTNHIYALQSTINDHRTMIDDHRKMIYYLMNNTVNITQLNQHYSDQHVRTAPIWQSWRDTSLLVLLVICLITIVYLLVKRLRILDLLTAFLVRRQHHQEQMPAKSNPSKHLTVVKNRLPKQQPQPTAVLTPFANVTQEYIRQQYDSNQSF